VGTPQEDFRTDSPIIDSEPASNLDEAVRRAHERRRGEDSNAPVARWHGASPAVSHGASPAS
jgi:hypothetical protein